MITAEQARKLSRDTRALTVDKEKLEEAEKAIMSATKYGENECHICVPYGEDYSSVKDELEERGFNVSYGMYDMLIYW